MNRRSVIIAAVILAVSVLWVLSGVVFGDRKAPEQTAQAPGSKPPALQASVQVRRQSAEMMQAALSIPGQTEAFRKVSLRAEVAGPVETILAERGATLRAGQPVLRIAARARRERLDEATARLAQRRIEFEAASSLQAKGFQSQIRLAETKSLFEAAEAEQRQAALDVAHLEVKSPIDGVLETREAEVGSFMEVNGVVGTIVDLDPIRVVANATERDVTQLRPGMKGSARLLDGTALDGTITYVAASAEPNTRTFRVELEVPNPGNRIRDGLTASLSLPMAETKAHRVSPGILTLADNGTVGVKLVEADGTARFAPVQLLGNAPDGGVWLGGLPDIITLVTVGQDFITHGQKVTTVMEKAP
ncbi:MAG: efflux RND transporter periplasmic adaptor subunit [Niveispirillum sp.]|uniref:efflux RND transporter periplasmic adaptor subunit n=1 Tax=Niveispirillum sp. TaxID=1917217 RepID=UPI0040361295